MATSSNFPYSPRYSNRHKTPITNNPRSKTRKAIKANDSIPPTSLQRPQIPRQSGSTTMTYSSTLNPAYEIFLIVQTEDGESNQNQPQPQPQQKPYDQNFTFVGAVYKSLTTANTAAQNLAAKKCTCKSPSITFPAFKKPATTTPTTTTARPQFIQQRSGDGRYTCCCIGSSGDDGEEGKGFRFEVRKIEVKRLGSRMGWNFSDDDA